MAGQVMAVKNRTNKAFEFMFDGQVYKVEPFETETMITAAAVHGMRKSIISYNPSTGTSVRALVPADSEEAKYELDGRKEGSELIERDDPDEVILKKFANPDMRGSRVTSSLDGE